MVEFLAFIFAAGLGFGVAFWIAATLLNNSNNIGDYHAEANHYSAHVDFSVDNVISGRSARDGSSGVRFTKPSTPAAPRGTKKIEKPVNIRPGENKDSEDSSTDDSKETPQIKPPRKGSPGFPKPFNDV